jgi:hypothetical protein
MIGECQHQETVDLEDSNARWCTECGAFHDGTLWIHSRRAAQPPAAVPRDGLQRIIGIVEAEYGWKENHESPEHREQWAVLDTALEWINRYVEGESPPPPGAERSNTITVSVRGELPVSAIFRHAREIARLTETWPAEPESYYRELLQACVDGWTKGDDIAGPILRAKAALTKEVRHD